MGLPDKTQDGMARRVLDALNGETAVFWNTISARRIALALLIPLFLLVCCLTFVLGAEDYGMAYIFFDAGRLPLAAAVAVAFAAVACVFLVAGFSFGYLVGFYCYALIFGYLWLNCFSPFKYDHRTAGLSAAISAVAFLLPALFITAPFSQRYTLSERGMRWLLAAISSFAVAIAVVASTYHFRLTGVDEIYAYREQVVFPTAINYAIPMTLSVLLPYAFACHLARRDYWWAGAVALICLAYFPITLTKAALFTPAWLLMFALLGKLFETRVATVLTLLLPLLAGVILFLVLHDLSYRFFNIVNMRMMIAPSSAMDFYNEYFTRHDFTHFCQIRVLKPMIPCHLEVPLSVEMANVYGLGNMNASLFATEGIASVGPYFAPVTALVCGLVVAVGNRASAGLPANFVFVSSALLTQVFLNVPFTVIMLTHGTALLFVLWYVTPRTVAARE